MLARFGQAIVVERGTDRTVAEWRTCIEASLARTQDALAAEARHRDVAAFDTLVGGQADTSRIADFSRRFASRLLGMYAETKPGAPRSRRRAAMPVMITIVLAAVVAILAAIPALSFGPTCAYRPPPLARVLGEHEDIPKVSVLIPARTRSTPSAMHLPRSSPARALISK